MLHLKLLSILDNITMVNLKSGKIIWKKLKTQIFWIMKPFYNNIICIYYYEYDINI